MKTNQSQNPAKPLNGDSLNIYQLQAVDHICKEVTSLYLCIILDTPLNMNDDFL